MPDLHPDIASLAFLLGTWRGEGRGDYPTIEPFTYVEEVAFTQVGKPFLAYGQQTRRAGDHPEAGRPLHAESGYMRPAGPGRVELVIAQPSGIVEVDEGEVSETSLWVRSVSVALTSSAKQVDSIERRIEVIGAQLTYQLWMGAVGEPHQLHLQAVLNRV